VIARFAVDVDDSKLNRLDKKILSGKRNLMAFASYAATAFVTAGYGMYKMVDAASDADEALNVLSRTFGKQTDSVLKWSSDTGAIMSRSMYDLQDSVGKFGAFLEPQFKGTTTDIAAMSKALTELSVDLASFYNTSDQEAAMRLFSGISGETEAVRRLGIDISDTALDAFNKKRGPASTKNKRMASLSLQEKTMLRYQKILNDTVSKQGDAELTAESWANQLKQTQGRIKDLAVVLGRRLIPFAKDLLKVGNKLVDAFEFLTRRTDGLRDAFLALVAVGAVTWMYHLGAAVVAAGLIGGVAQLTAGIEALVFAAGGLVAFAALEDIWSFFQGKDTVISDFITMTWGLQDPLQAVLDIAEDIADSFMRAANAALAIASVPFVGYTKAKANYEAALNAPRHQVMRDAARASQFTSLAERGDYQGAVSNRPQSESEDAAEKRALEVRASYLEANPGARTQRDIDLKTTNARDPLPQAPTAASAWSGMVSAPTAFSAVPAGSSEPKAPSNITINVSGVSDPMAASQEAFRLWQREDLKQGRVHLEEARRRTAGEKK